VSELADEEHDLEDEGVQDDNLPDGGGDDPGAPAEPDPVASDEPAVPDSATTDAAAEAQATVEAMLGAIRQARVGELILSTVSTLASVAYGKLEAKELGEARLAIDAVGALLPLLNGEVEDGIRRDFEQALTNLRLAYADAVGPGDSP
jgi:hypothetical protein